MVGLDLEIAMRLGRSPIENVAYRMRTQRWRTHARDPGFELGRHVPGIHGRRTEARRQEHRLPFGDTVITHMRGVAQDFNRLQHRSVPGVSPEALSLLMAYMADTTRTTTHRRRRYLSVKRKVSLKQTRDLERQHNKEAL